MKTALITGITGQDGAHLAAFLLEKGYSVFGLRQWSATPDGDNIAALGDSGRFKTFYGDLCDSGSLSRMVKDLAPDEIYNLGAQSHVKISYDLPEMTADVNALGVLRLLEAIRNAGLERRTRFYQASSSEMFGNAPAPQNENTPFAPCSPYAAAKAYAYWIVSTYRQAYGIHASNGILFNHESTIRGEEFVTRRIARAAARIGLGLQKDLTLGNLDARRDWGHARDYVEGMWRMLQQDTPGDYVLATGRTRSVREFVEKAFACAGFRLVWRGAGVEERGYDARSGRCLVRIDPDLFRPNEVHCLCGDSRRARETLGWEPRIGFDALVREMVESERRFATGAAQEPHAALSRTGT